MKANEDMKSIGILKQGEISPPGQGPPSHSDQPLCLSVPPSLLLLPPCPLSPLPSLSLPFTHQEQPLQQAFHICFHDGSREAATEVPCHEAQLLAGL